MPANPPDVWRLSRANAPWIHSGIQSGSLDAKQVAHDLAVLIDPSDQELVNTLTTFFQGVSDFDRTGCDLKATAGTLNGQQRAEAVFHHLGIRILELSPAPVKSKEHDWICSSLAPLALADRLAWLAQPSKQAPPVCPRPRAFPNQKDRLKSGHEIKNWWESLRVLKVAMNVPSEPLFHPAKMESAPRTSRCMQLQKGTKGVKIGMLKLNLEGFVYGLKAFLLGDPTFNRDTREKLVRSDITPEWSDAEIENAIEETRILELCSPIFMACLFYSPGILTKTGITDHTPWPFADSWMCRGNLHLLDDANTNLISIDRTFWILLLRAALGKISLDQIVPSFFNDLNVSRILETCPTSAEMSCLHIPSAGDFNPPITGPLTLTGSIMDNTDLIQMKAAEYYDFEFNFDGSFDTDLSQTQSRATISVPTTASLPVVASTHPLTQTGSVVSNGKEVEGGGGQEKRIHGERGVTEKDNEVEGGGGQEKRIHGERGVTEKDNEQKEGESDSNEPPKKKRKANSVDKSDRKLRPRSTPAVLSTPVALIPPTSSDAVTRPKLRSKRSAKAPTPAGSHPSTWVAVSDGWAVPTLREAEVLETAKRLDPTKLYDVWHTPLPIDYWVFSPTTADGGLQAEKKTFHYRPFAATAEEDLKALRKIMDSQPTVDAPSYHHRVPLHVDPLAQRFCSDGDAIGPDQLSDIVPGPNISVIFVAAEENWRKLSGRQMQELLRNRCALIISKTPYNHDGQEFTFNEESFARFTNVERLAFVQDLGARSPTHDLKLVAGRPSDLLYCSEQRRHREGLTPPGKIAAENQVLNLLSNRLPSRSMPAPSGWTRLASHEFATSWLQDLATIPEFSFPHDEVKWGVFATEGAMTWIRGDVLFTGIMLASGEKLLWIGRRREGVKSHRGNIRSRNAFDGFDGWTSMTDIYEFEMVHLDRYTTLYIPATTMYCVLSITDCIATGVHGIPIGNALLCVLMMLHNSIVSSITTNADHEPARRFLLRIFIYISRAFTDAAKAKKAVPTEMRQHLPDLGTADGILDVLALRSFVILFMALTSSAYPHQSPAQCGPHARALPFNTNLWKEIMCSWTLALELDMHILEAFEFEQSAGSGPGNFEEAGNIVLLEMAASMVKYREDRPDLKLPKEFTTPEFTAQLRQMLGRFDLRRQHFNHENYENVSKPHHEVDSAVPAEAFGELPLVKRFDDCLGKEDHTFLLVWDAETLPFKLLPRD
ncbi:hypothetical protein C8F04DRAFT_1268106 [Mycena alexandri]|uniref:Uncharacterized protein n=1 Tax=Mycena alexandri TaxID=1745969 RepID=A0AAD6WVQ4_9AGAR|nr:hypothetical protein C8F04DRAFT_1268106 [Mycena alexandri]